MMAQRNQLREALSDSQLKQMLEQISDSVRRLPAHLLPPRCECLTAAAPRSTQLHTPALPQSLHTHAPLAAGRLGLGLGLGLTLSLSLTLTLTLTLTPCGRALAARRGRLW